MSKTSNDRKKTRSESQTISKFASCLLTYDSTTSQVEPQAQPAVHPRGVCVCVWGGGGRGSTSISCYIGRVRLISNVSETFVFGCMNKALEQKTPLIHGSNNENK